MGMELVMVDMELAMGVWEDMVVTVHMEDPTEQEQLITGNK